MTSKATMSLPSKATDPKLTPKHNIFLSHSGAQKRFVEQLCKDLEEGCHYPFFDQRDDSLPEGQKFASLIFDAARQCRVGVVVLSKEFLTSKWPMHELVAFVNARESDNKNLNLLPLFFELSTADLSDECISNRWMGEWTKLAEKDSRVDVEKWKNAVQELRAINGLVFARSGNSVVSYREAVVSAIFRLVPPDLLYDTSEVQGCDRICKKLSEMFVEYTSSGDNRLLQPQRLGLYGMGGLGKTTMCKALCNHFQVEFCGRVCYVELGSEAPLVLQKISLRKLLRLGEDVLNDITDTSQGRKCLNENMRRQPVFLVIDNVGDEEACRSEARAYLDACFHPSSKIVVTSRSRDVVKALLYNPEYCQPIPDLMMDEAAVIFLRKAAPGKKFLSLQGDERRIVDLCLEQCRFSPNGDPYADLKKDGQYHPLALGALGVYFHDIDHSNLLYWEDRLDDFDKLKLSRECPGIFRILGLQFGTFDRAKKLIFLDVALYAHGRIRRELKSLKDWVNWLAALHNETDKFVKHKLSDLERNAMINQGESAVTTHDLYKEYAEWYVTQGGDAKDWCVYRKHAEDLPRELKRSPPSGGCWPNLVRISMEIHGLKCVKIPSKKVQEWRNISVLQLHSCTNLTDMDLQGFSCLCHLELVGLKKLETLTFSEVDDAQYPLDLQFVILEKLEALKHLPNFSFCTSLRLFVMEECESLTEPPNLESCSSLCYLRVDWYPTQLRTPNLSGMTSLRDLSILGKQFGHEPIQLEGLSSVINLKRLYLSTIPITRLPGLEMLTKLRYLRVDWYPTQLRRPNLSKMMSWRDLSILVKQFGHEPIQLERLSSVINLKRLYLSTLPITRLPGLEKLTKLRHLNVERCVFLTELPDLRALTNLETLIVSFNLYLKEIQGVDKLLQLRTLDCRWCRALKWLPDLDQLPCLKYVITLGCKRLHDHRRPDFYD